jgi:superfamily II DNA or RNA helicase
MAEQWHTKDSAAELRRELDEARRECARLREENARLRQMLGLSSDAGGPALAEPAPTLFPAAQPLRAIDARSPTEQKIALFRTLFRGREDVYPVLWVSERTGKKGYSPACRQTGAPGHPDQRGAGGSSDGRRRPKEYLSLTDEVVAAHLSGQKTIGVYPLLRDDTCWFLACDFDGEGWALDALEFLAVCERHGVPSYLERSRSGNGGHVWIFFSSPVSAVSARRLGMWFLRETMVSRAEMDLASYDRFFPNQDFLPKGGFGNLIALPLQKTCRALGNTEFLDSSLRPWPDQWAILSRVKRLSPSQVEAVLESATGTVVAADPKTTKIGPAPSRQDRPAPSKISCTLAAEITVLKSGLPPSLLSQIKHLASLHNPLFYERQKLRLSTYRTPRFIKCYQEDASHIHLPRGMLEDLRAAVKAVGSRLVITDLRPVPDRSPFTFRGSLTLLQEEAIKTLLSHDQGVLVAPPGTGKTVMGCYVAAVRGLPTLVMVHRKPLLNQWRDQLVSLLGLVPKQVGQVGGGRRMRTGVIDLAMIQSLRDLENATEFFRDYGLIIVDECHHLPAFSFEACVKQAPVRYLLGLTATPYRRDGLQDIITMQCGPVRHVISTSHRGALDDLVRELVVRETSFLFQGTDDTPVQEVFRAVVHDEGRTGLVCNDILNALADGRKCLVLSEWKEHCRSLADRLAGHGKNAFVLHGGVRKKARDAVLRFISERPEDATRGSKASGPSDSALLIIATGQYLGEGFDCPQLDTLFLAFPVSFRGKLVQYVGRVMRSCEGKNLVSVYDYADLQVPVLRRMHAKRLKTFRTLGFEQVHSPRFSGASGVIEARLV